MHMLKKSSLSFSLVLRVSLNDDSVIYYYPRRKEDGKKGRKRKGTAREMHEERERDEWAKERESARILLLSKISNRHRESNEASCPASRRRIFFFLVFFSTVFFRRFFWLSSPAFLRLLSFSSFSTLREIRACGFCRIHQGFVELPSLLVLLCWHFDTCSVAKASSIDNQKKKKKRLMYLMKLFHESSSFGIDLFFLTLITLHHKPQ